MGVFYVSGELRGLFKEAAPSSHQHATDPICKDGAEPKHCEELLPESCIHVVVDPATNEVVSSLDAAERTPLKRQFESLIEI